jgi:hypothetical protein
MKNYSEIIKSLENQIDLIEDIVSLKREIDCHLSYNADFRSLFPRLAEKGIKRVELIEKEIAEKEKEFIKNRNHGNI